MKLPQIIRFSDYLKETPSEAVRTVGDHQIHGARNSGQEDCILVSIVSPKAGFEKA